MTMTKTELILVPSPGMGHLHAAVELAKLLVRREPAVSAAVLAVSDPSDASLVAAYLDSQQPRGPRLELMSLPPPGQAPDTSSRKAFFTSLSDLNRPIVRRALMDRVGSGSPRPAVLIFDMFFAPMVDLADELGVPSYLFYVSGANFLNVTLHMQSRADYYGEEKGVDRVIHEFGDPDKESVLPGFKNRVPGKILPSVFLDRDGGSEVFVSLARNFRRMKGILVNSFVELETYGIHELMEQDRVPQLYPVGPVLKLDGARDRKEEQDSIMEWLDQQPVSSVVFLCFGSMGCFDAAQVKEIADGLERSGHRFLWSLRRPPSEGKLVNVSHREVFIEALPEGFLKRTRNQGRVIGWAPQVAVLAHPSVGGFVSHCGWNSILESLWFGVPVATWPLHAEQQLNAFTMVKELELAVEIRMDYRKELRTKHGNFLVTSTEVESGVKKLMSMDKEKKNKVKEMSEKARKALEDGGSSSYWLGRFIEDILGKDNGHV